MRTQILIVAAAVAIIGVVGRVLPEGDSGIVAMIVLVLFTCWAMSIALARTSGRDR